MTERFILRLDTSGRPTDAKPKSPQGITDCHVGLRPPRNDGGVWSPRPTSAVKLCPLRPSAGKSAACTARDVEDAVPYESGILDCQKLGAALCSRAGLPLRSNGDYSVLLKGLGDKRAVSVSPTLTFLSLQLC